MAGENNQSIFGGRSGFGNRGKQFADSPQPAPPTRSFLDYGADRAESHIPSPSVFKDTGYKNTEPTVLKYDLSVARVDVAVPVAGNLIWYQSSTNTTDIITIKMERTSAVGIPFQPGNKLGGVPFSQLYISNAIIAGAFGFLILLQDSPEQPVSVL